MPVFNWFRMYQTGATQTYSYLETKEALSVEFSVLDQEELLRTSVVEVKNERIYEQGFMWPTLDGVNDPRMGTIDKDRLCFTCKGTQVDCPGHFGHIELAKPMYHAGFLEYIRKILKCLCFNCAKLLYPWDKDHINDVRRIKASRHRFYQILRHSDKDGSRMCDIDHGGCGMRQPKFYKKGLGIEVEFTPEGRNDSCSGFMDQLGYTSADKR